MALPRILSPSLTIWATLTTPSIPWILLTTGTNPFTPRSLGEVPVPSPSLFVPTNGYHNIIAHEISGWNTLDQHRINPQSAPGTGANAVTSGNVTTTTNGQYIFGATIQDDFGPIAITPGTGFTERESTDADNATVPQDSEDRIQATAGNIAATFTQNVNKDICTCMMTFKP